MNAMYKHLVMIMETSYLSVAAATEAVIAYRYSTDVRTKG